MSMLMVIGRHHLQMTLNTKLKSTTKEKCAERESKTERDGETDSKNHNNDVGNKKEGGEEKYADPPRTEPELEPPLSFPNRHGTDSDSRQTISPA